MSEASVHPLLACVLFRGHSFDQIYMKLCQNINLYEIRSSSKWVMLVQKQGCRVKLLKIVYTPESTVLIQSS